MSKLINKTRLTKFANDLWTKIKGRYDVAFKNATISPGTGDEKHITFERISGQDPLQVSLADYARLQDRNEFKKDVSVDDADFYNNATLGNITGTINPARRTLGARNLTSKMFTDGFVSTLRIHLDNSHTGNSFSVHLWEIKKGENKEADRTISKLKSGESFTVTQAGDKKYVDIAINKKYADDTYFLFRSGDSAEVKAIRNIPSDKANDVMNLVDTTPPTEADRPLDLNSQIQDTTAYVEIFGRIGIKDLNSKINQLQADGSKYVLQSETTTTSEANKVVRLGGDGKINANMMPSIAIGEYFEISEFTDDALRGLNHYENGDTVVVTSGTDKGARYLCINKSATGALTDAFIKLNDKNGLVTSVNDATGAVTLKIEATTDKLQFKVNDIMKSEVEIISDTEITEILNRLN